MNEIPLNKNVVQMNKTIILNIRKYEERRRNCQVFAENHSENKNNTEYIQEPWKTHSTNFLPLICSQVLNRTGPRGNPIPPFPSDFLQHLLGDPKVFPGQRGHIIPSVDNTHLPGDRQGTFTHTD